MSQEDFNQEQELDLPTQDEIKALTSHLLTTIQSQSSSDPSTNLPLSQLISSLTPQFLTIKSLHRQLQSQLLQSKSNVSKSKDKVDEKTLTLNDLKYEKSQLKKEIEQCRDFNSIYQNVPLCSVEEFERVCDLEELKTKEVREDPHRFMLARLKWELVERQRREAEKQAVTSSKAIVVKQNKEKRSKLDKLDDQLKEMHATAKKIEASLEDF